MAQFDLLLTQNVHATGIEFSEKYVNIVKGGLLSAATGGVPTVLAPAANGKYLVTDSAEATGLKWADLPSLGQLHDQNTDTGTNSTVFELDNDGFKIELTAESASKFGVKVDGGAGQHQGGNTPVEQERGLDQTPDAGLAAVEVPHLLELRQVFLAPLHQPGIIIDDELDAIRHGFQARERHQSFHGG